MPFSSSGVYTPASGATVAAPGQVIASATWNSINADYTTALTTVGQASAVNQPRVINVAAPFTVTTTDYIVQIHQSVGTITMPLSSTRTYPVKIIGTNNGVFATPATVVATAPDGFSNAGTGNGTPTITLTVNYQVATFYPLASGGYIVCLTG